jgi:hypothetical protein
MTTSDDRLITRQEFEKEMENFRYYVFGQVASMIRKATGEDFRVWYDEDNEPCFETHQERFERELRRRTQGEGE